MANDFTKLTARQLRQKLDKAQREWARTGSVASLANLEELRAEATLREQNPA